MRTNRTIKRAMGRYVGSTTDNVEQYKNSEKKMEEISEISQEIKKISIALPINPARAMKSGGSRESGENILRRVATIVAIIPVIFQTLIPC